MFVQPDSSDHNLVSLLSRTDEFIPSMRGRRVAHRGLRMETVALRVKEANLHILIGSLSVRRDFFRLTGVSLQIQSEKKLNFEFLNEMRISAPEIQVWM